MLNSSSASSLRKRLVQAVEQRLAAEGLLGIDYARYADDPVGFGQEILGERYTEDVKRLMESVRDYPVTIAISANGTGKTHSAAAIAVWWYKCREESQVYTGAAPPESNLERLLWGEINNRVAKHPKLFETDDCKHLSISRGPKDFVVGVTIPSTGTEKHREAKFSGKHARNLLFILDEGDAIPDEVYKGIESCMSGGHPRLLVMFNPRQKLGAAYRMIRDGQANVIYLTAFNHPNVITGDDHLFDGAVSRGVTVRRIVEWTRPLQGHEPITGDCFEVPDFLVGTVAYSKKGEAYPPLTGGWRKIREPEFSYMVLAQYASQGTRQLISEEWTSAARARWDAYVAVHGETPPEGVRGVLGQDVGELGTDDSAAVFRYGGFVPRIITWNGVDPAVTSDRAAELCKSRNIRVANVDGTGVGSAVAPLLIRNGVPAVSVKVADGVNKTELILGEMGTFHILRDYLWWATREWLRTDPGAMLPPDELLLEDLLSMEYEKINGEIRVTKGEDIRKLLGRSPDRGSGLCLTFYTPPGAFDDSVFR